MPSVDGTEQLHWRTLCRGISNRLEGSGDLFHRFDVKSLNQRMAEEYLIKEAPFLGL